ncbi:MAG: response regulator transcription factor [Planctomycetota bacterium]
MKRILIIEDDATLQRSLGDNFRHRGFDVVLAGKGSLAREIALRDEADVMLLDIMLPEINGFEICRSVRKHGVETPIIMLTAKGQVEDVIRGLDLGADDYVTKPFSIDELVARVHALIRRSSGNDRVIRFGDCELDINARTLRRDGKPVTLTSKEFGMLMLFVTRSGRAFTRNEILNRVWGRTIVVSARSVDRCVTTLRAKIEIDPSRPQWIKTIRDVGYRFERPSES